MKKIFTLLSLLICSLVYSQNIFWYDVMLEVNSSINASTVAGLVDDFYSNHPKPSNVNVAFNLFKLFRATYINMGTCQELTWRLASYGLGER